MLDTAASSLNFAEDPRTIISAKKTVLPSVHKGKDVILTNIEKCILLVSEAVIGMCLVFKW